MNLPINEIMGGSGGPTVAEAKVKGGKKKEAVVQCAQEACRILNQYSRQEDLPLHPLFPRQHLSHA